MSQYNAPLMGLRGAFSYVEEMEPIDIPEHLLNYFDYEEYKRNVVTPLNFDITKKDLSSVSLSICFPEK